MDYDSFHSFGVNFGFYVCLIYPFHKSKLKMVQQNLVFQNMTCIRKLIFGVVAVLLGDLQANIGDLIFVFFCRVEISLPNRLMHLSVYSEESAISGNS